MSRIIALVFLMGITSVGFSSSVTITASCTGDTLTVGYANATGGVPVGVSMEVNMTSGDCYVNSASDVTAGADGKHEVYIDWAYTNGTGTLNPLTGVSTTTSAHPLALIGSAGAATLPTVGGGDFALCMAELATTPASSGTLAVIKFSLGTTTSCCFQLQADTSNRGGIVDQYGNPMTVTWPSGPICCGGTPPCTCPGDANKNNVINVSDISTIVGWLTPIQPPYFPPYTITKSYPIGAWAGKECADANGNNVINVSDLSTIIGWLTPLKAPTYIPPYTKACP